MAGFEHIRGHLKAKKLLDRALIHNRLSHAYLFSGPDGVGKAAMARAFAAQLLCEAPQPHKPCGHCPGCKKLASDNHPDFMRVIPDGAAIKIAQIRQLKEAFIYSPFEKGYRVVILEDVQTMRREAGNSLLKILEEPPADNLFILLGSSKETLLPTIVSRCQVIPFFPLSPADAAAVIAARSPELSQEETTLLAALADGSPGRALTIQTSGLFDLFQDFLQTILQPYASQSRRVEKGLLLGAQISQFKEELPVLLQLLRIFFKDVMAAHISDQRNGIYPDQIAAARELWNLDQLSAKIAAVDLAEKALGRNCNRALVCEVLLLDLF